jgi:inorganic triphosphatase YgiF
VQETELKFQVPPAQRAALLRAVATASAQTTRLRAAYVDTPALDLARAGLALRLRQEGRVWVQTLKGRGDGLMQRLEHEVRLPPQRGVPALDLQRHAGTPAAAALSAALPAGAELQVLYRTDIQRLHRRARFEGAVIEIAYDRGALHAGGRSAQVDEIEFELLSGAPAALAGLARRWAARHGLWWDCRTKSERGTRLALQREQVPATEAVAAAWRPGATPGAAWAAALQAALAQALPNAAEIASGQGTPEHLHQLRVALRRLRSHLRVLAPWSGQADAALALEADWRPVFMALGTAREADLWAARWAPRLQAAGAPDWAPPGEHGAAAPADIVVGAVFNDLLLRSLVLALPPHAAAMAAVDGTLAKAAVKVPAAAIGVADHADLAGAAVALLRGPWRTARRDASHFAAATEDEQHRTRKRLKRLRYALEALQPLFDAKATRRLLKAMRGALQALGDLNDLQSAAALCRAHAEAEPRAWFAAGWLAAQRVPAQARAERALSRLADAPGPSDLRKAALRRKTPSR